MFRSVCRELLSPRTLIHAIGTLGILAPVHIVAYGNIYQYPIPIAVSVLYGGGVLLLVELYVLPLGTGGALERARSRLAKQFHSGISPRP